MLVQQEQGNRPPIIVSEPVTVFDIQNITTSQVSGDVGDNSECSACGLIQGQTWLDINGNGRRDGEFDDALLGFADIVIDFFDSGAGPLPGPYGGTFPGGPGYPRNVGLNVVLGDDPGPTGFNDFLSLPTGSYVTVGFEDETVVDGPGNDIFIAEVGASGEQADVFVSSNSVDFVYLGRARDNSVTSFDLASISFSETGCGNQNRWIRQQRGLTRL